MKAPSPTEYVHVEKVVKTIIILQMADKHSCCCLTELLCACFQNIKQAFLALVYPECNLGYETTDSNVSQWEFVRAAQL